jgi:hypothetical protein
MRSGEPGRQGNRFLEPLGPDLSTPCPPFCNHRNARLESQAVNRPRKGGNSNLPPSPFPNLRDAVAFP